MVHLAKLLADSSSNETKLKGGGAKKSDVARQYSSVWPHVTKYRSLFRLEFILLYFE